MTPPRRGRGGFTLIEVMGALVIFALGVLMTMNLTESASMRLNRAAVQSELMARARTVVDSLTDLGYVSLPILSQDRTLTIRNISYEESLSVTQFSPLVKRAEVTLEPAGGAQGPRYGLTSFVAGAW